ncbi:uncharacterized protein METZ01_LOCUS263916, partial [marine metagenome]
VLCSECDNQILPYMTFCPHCGIRIKKVSNSSEYSTESPDELKPCSHCGALAEATLRYCGSCGTQLEDSIETSPEPPPIEEIQEEKQELKSCPTCNQPVRPELSFCISCGTNVITSERRTES